MQDLEITKLCAEAMDIPVHQATDGLGNAHIYIGLGTRLMVYDPLHDDAQAMALVKKFRLETRFSDDFWSNSYWRCALDNNTSAYDKDLNRAICECVAKMQAAKVEADRRFGQPHYGHDRSP